MAWKRLILLAWALVLPPASALGAHTLGIRRSHALGVRAHARGARGRSLTASAPDESGKIDGSSERPEGGFWKNYKFGDVSKLLDGKVKSAVNELTGKESYEFGDISRLLDNKAKSAVNELTGKESYEFGDISRLLDDKAKSAVCNATGNANYEVGDITKEIAKRVRTRQYTLEDLFFLIKALLTFQLGMSSVAAFLPVKLLIDLLNYSLMADVGDRVAGYVALEIDKRIKKALMGDENYKIGDLTMRAINKFTGSETYEFGDLSRAVMRRSQQPPSASPLLLGAKTPPNGAPLQTSDGDVQLDSALQRELQDWDRAAPPASAEDVPR